MSSTAETTAQPFSLVVGVDLTETEASGFALDQAARIAVRISGSEMHVLHVTSKDATEEATRQAVGLLQLYLTEKAALLGGLAQQYVGIHVRPGDAAHEIAQLADDVAADVIVVGAHRAPNVKNLVAGSTGQRLMNISNRPVLVAGPKPRPQPSHIITIEPPCPDCLVARAASQGRTWWCQRHSEHHHLRYRHIYSYQTRLPFAQHDSEVSATGV